MRRNAVASVPPVAPGDECAACSSHLVQFYDNDRFLTGSVAEYARLGLESGEAVILVATQAHWTSIVAELERMTPGVSNRIADGQLQFFDAQLACHQVLDGGVPSRGQFRTLIDTVSHGARKRFRGIRFFNELVHLLCARGAFDAAIEIETYWNELLATEEGVSLLCGYHANVLRRSETVDDFARIQLHHADGIQPLSSVDLADEDALYRRLAVLEQRAARARRELRERARVETELAHVKRELMQAGRLSILADLSASLARELAIPHAQLNAAGHEIEKQLVPVDVRPPTADPAIAQQAAIVLRVAERLGRIATGLEAFAEPTPPARRLVSVRHALDTALAVTRMSRDAAKIKLSTNLTTDELVTVGNEERLAQVFGCVLDNAREAIERCRDGRRGHIAIVLRSTERGDVEVTVADNGVGMSAATVDQIYFPFFTTKEAGQGSGLGLSIAHGIVRDHDGKMDCRSLEGTGTEFKIVLPRPQGSARPGKDEGVQ